MSSPTPEALHERLSDEQIAYLLSMHRLEPDVAGTRMPWAKDWPLDRLMTEAAERLRERGQPSAAPAQRAPTCETCQHWQRASAQSVLAGPMRCMHVLSPCGQVQTAPDFGCTLHEPAATPTPGAGGSR